MGTPCKFPHVSKISLYTRFPHLLIHIHSKSERDLDEISYIQKSLKHVAVQVGSAHSSGKILKINSRLKKNNFFSTNQKSFFFQLIKSFFQLIKKFFGTDSTSNMAIKRPTKGHKISQYW